MLQKLPARWLIIFVLSFVALAYRTYLGEMPLFALRYSLPGVADAFLLGMFVAAISDKGWIGRAAGVLFPLGAAWYIALRCIRQPAQASTGQPRSRPPAR